MLRYLTSGESHGKCLIAILDGMPAGLKVDESLINEELARRMAGYGRGGRMKIEADKAQILSGLRRSMTIGSPITVMVKNIDQSIDKLPVILEPRPGHADLTGAIKYDRADIRDVLERARDGHAGERGRSLQNFTCGIRYPHNEPRNGHRQHRIAPQ